MTKGGHPEEFRLLGVNFSLQDDINNIVRDCTHPKTPKKIIENLLLVTQSKSSEFMLTLLNDGGIETPGGSTDIIEHISVHGSYDLVKLYGIPKMDLGICWIKKKLPIAFRVLLNRINHQLVLLNNEQRVVMEDMQRKLRQYKRFLGNIDKQSWRNNWEEIVEIERTIGASFEGEESYGFFTYLAPFYRDEDGKKIQPAYKRRDEFLERIQAINTGPNIHSKPKNDIRARLTSWLSRIV